MFNVKNISDRSYWSHIYKCKLRNLLDIDILKYNTIVGSQDTNNLGKGKGL